MLLPAENNRPTQLRLALPRTGPYAGNEMGSVFCKKSGKLGVFCKKVENEGVFL